MDDTSRADLASEGTLQRRYEDSLVLLDSVRRSLAEILDQILKGDTDRLRDLSAKQTELERALRHAFDAETRINEWHARQSGQQPEGDIDFDLIRHEIGCRLARLRECCEPD